MLEGYKILTVTHREVPLEKISDFLLPYKEERELQSKLQYLQLQLQLEELLYISTCNRVVFAFQLPQSIDIPFINSFFQTINPSLTEEAIQNGVVAYEGKEAVVHLYEVASSIDSLVVGEREIMRQIRESYTQCKEWGLTGDRIRLLMKHLVQASKEVYAKTRIGEKQVSIVSLAMQELRQRNLPKDARILLVGAGQTNTLVSKFLIKQGFYNFTVFNRNKERAKVLADTINGQAHALSTIDDYKKGFDCLIVCTGATQAIIHPQLYKQLLHGDTATKVVIDLSIPNNVDKKVLSDFPTDYIDIEELKELADLNLSLRRQEIGVVKILLDKQIEEFEKAYRERQIELAMRDVPIRIKDIKRRAIEEVFKKDLDNLDAPTRALFEEMLTYMERKCISIPMIAAKELVEEDSI